MERVADYIANYISQKGIDTVFMVSGGGMMFLSDGLAQNDKIKVVCTHHEQAAGMAAESYSKYKNGVGVAFVTSGCGSTNAITPLLGAWQDSVPCVFISGQAKRKETIRNSGLPLRQFGVQEVDIIPIVHSITKYAATVSKPEDIAIEMDKAFHYARSGRPGPVWIEVPLDVQSAGVDANSLERWDCNTVRENYKTEVLVDELRKVGEHLSRAERPLIIAGNGILLSGSVSDFKIFIERYNIPVVYSRLGINILSSDHPQNIGLIGNKGQRAANMAVQNTDLLLVLGSRLSVSSTGHEYHTFAREAKKIVVDIDPVEHSKNTVAIDVFINADVSAFLKQLNAAKLNLNIDESWRTYCSALKEKYPRVSPEYKDDGNGLNLYDFVAQMSENMPQNIPVVTDSGSTSYVVPQAITLREGQRYFTSSAQGEMGYSLPGSMGISLAGGKCPVICITGDGSLQMNIQELQTIVHYQLPIKIFVWNNDGYLSIKSTQDKFFNGRYIGSNRESGVSFPDLKKIAGAYNINYCRVEKSGELKGVFREVFSNDAPVICEVMCDPNQQILPTVSSYTKPDGTIVSKPLEDMFPFLARDEFYRNMLIKPLDE
ncbi:MAG: thiamine pyrophosphate-binding protein [Chitinispirillia bacterium]|nr:thiamine pyrophosphate-binding protein [Chitinispirillia bacterium]MCL2268776.1 thiamine pyrophosphate-binding protein [Chitinispirillia bacterium]